MFPAYAMMRAPEPYLQAAGDPVYSRQEFGSTLPCPLGLRSVVIVLRLQGNHITSCALVSEPNRQKACHGANRMFAAGGPSGQPGEFSLVPAPPTYGRGGTPPRTGVSAITKNTTIGGAGTSWEADEFLDRTGTRVSVRPCPPAGWLPSQAVSLLPLRPRAGQARGKAKTPKRHCSLDSERHAA